MDFVVPPRLDFVIEVKPRGAAISDWRTLRHVRGRRYHRVHGKAQAITRSLRCAANVYRVQLNPLIAA